MKTFNIVSEHPQPLGVVRLFFEMKYNIPEEKDIKDYVITERVDCVSNDRIYEIETTDNFTERND